MATGRLIVANMMALRPHRSVAGGDHRRINRVAAHAAKRLMAAHGSIRFSLSRYNTEEEIDFTIDKVPAIISRLRELSPFVGQASAK